MTPTNLNLYYIFFLTAQCNNISGAAKQLYISQPAVSKAIKKLEKNLGCALFYRNSRGVRLTANGELLFEQIKEGFQFIDRGEHLLKKSKEIHMKHLKIGASATLCKYILLPQLPNFLKTNPYVTLSISCQSTNKTLKALENNTIDIGLIGETTENTQDYSFTYLQNIQDIFVTTNQYLDQLHIQGITPSLENVTLLLLDQDNLTRQYINHYFMENNLVPSAILEINTMDLLIEFVKAGLGVACVIKDFITNELRENSLIPFQPLPPIPPRRIGFATKEKPISCPTHIQNIIHSFQK